VGQILYEPAPVYEHLEAIVPLRAEDRWRSGSSDPGRGSLGSGGKGGRGSQAAKRELKAADED
jgi:hypothetical protein